jgi:hypothetical protein
MLREYPDISTIYIYIPLSSALFIQPKYTSNLAGTDVQQAMGLREPIRANAQK